MFCKWCGGNLASSDAKCKRCGKEVPALSDCGGFYDLVPGVKKPAEIHPVSAVPPAKPVKPTHKPEPPKEVKPAKNKKSSRKTPLGLATLTTAGFLVVIVMLLITLGKVSRYASEVDGLRNDLQTITEKINAIAEGADPEASKTERTEVLGSVLEEQNVGFTVKITGGDSAQEIDADLNLGDYMDTAVITYGLDQQTGRVNSVGYSLKEADAAVVVTIACNNEYRTQNVSVSYVIDDTAYGLSETPEICRWQYRFSGKGAWEDLPEDIFDRSDSNGKTKLSISETALQEFAAENEGEIELRCEIFRTNAESGSLTIVVEGIQFCENAASEEVYG